jgi:hypothetical protein
MLQVINYYSCNKNTLRGFVTVELTEPRIEMAAIALHHNNGKYYLTLPSKFFKKENGKSAGVPYVKFLDRNTWNRFQTKVINELRKAGYIQEQADSLSINTEGSELS